MRRIILITLATIALTASGFAQRTGFVQEYSYVIEGTDTMLCITLPTYVHIGFKNKKEEERFSRLLYNVRKVYPYARMSAVKLQEYDNMLAKISDKDQQKKMMKEAEKQLRKQFQKDIENLTFSQGVILIKLVDRETGKTTYKIVDELRGNLRAFFYQTIARLFGMNLKSQYDPNGKDKDIERIVGMIERGEL